MIKVTDEIRAAARRLLIKHNEAEAHRVEARFHDELARAASWVPPGMKVNEARVRESAAHERPADRDTRKRLEAIIDGKRKLIDARWWKEIHGTVDAKLLAKIAALADPERNSNEHERKVAAAKLAAAKAKRPPGVHPPPPPMPSLQEMLANLRKQQRKGKTTPRAPVSVTTTISIAKREEPYKGMAISSLGGSFHLMRGQDFPWSKSSWVSDAQADKAYRSLKAIHDAIDEMSAPVSDSVASPHVSDSVASAHTSDSVARLEALNKLRSAKRAAKRSRLKCQSCGKPLSAAQRITARYCNATCRSRAWRKSSC